jgi:hypothetical protein
VIGSKPLWGKDLLSNTPNEEKGLEMKSLKWLLVIVVIGVVSILWIPGAASSETQKLNQEENPNPEQADETQAYMMYLPFMTTRPATPPPATPSVNTFGVETWSYNQGENGSNLLNQANFYFIRRNALIWSDVEPSQGQRIWSAASMTDLEYDFTHASLQGKKIILIVRSTPGWAQKTPGKACGPIQDEDISAFANFMADVVKRYSVAPYNVMYYEIGNEPEAPTGAAKGTDTFGCWGDPTDSYYGGRYYARILQQVYPKMKQANANVNVMVGGLLLDCDPVNPPAGKDCTMAKYLEGILVEGGGPYFDSINFHSYDYYLGGYGNYSNDNWASASRTTGPTLIAKARFIRTLLANYGVTGKQVYATEVALVCQAGCGDIVHQKTKAYFAVEAYAAGIAEGLYGTVWYHQYNVWNQTGLMESDNNTIYDAFYATKFASQEIGTTQGGKNVSQGAFLIYELNTSAKGRIWVVWSKDGSTHSLTFSGTLPKTAFNTFGSVLTVQSSMDVGAAPIYLQWDSGS